MTAYKVYFKEVSKVSAGVPSNWKGSVYECQICMKQGIKKIIRAANYGCNALEHHVLGMHPKEVPSNNLTASPATPQARPTGGLCGTDQKDKIALCWAENCLPFRVLDNA